MTTRKICENCGRIPTKESTMSWRDPHTVCHEVVRQYAAHGGYGCDTGCCGVTIYGLNNKNNLVFSHFTFDHYYEGTETLESFVRGLTGNAWPTAVVDEELCQVECY